MIWIIQKIDNLFFYKKVEKLISKTGVSMAAILLIFGATLVQSGFIGLSKLADNSETTLPLEISPGVMMVLILLGLYLGKQLLILICTGCLQTSYLKHRPLWFNKYVVMENSSKYKAEQHKQKNHVNYMDI